MPNGETQARRIAGGAYGPRPPSSRWAPAPLQAASGGRGAARPPQPYPGSYPEAGERYPIVEKTYQRNKDISAVAGLSMGGGHTLMATNNNPGVFGYIGVPVPDRAPSMSL